MSAGPDSTYGAQRADNLASPVGLAKYHPRQIGRGSLCRHVI
jgi:hypothetical protein